jgi:hypothetical protein
MYDRHSESDLHYHELLLEFLQHLCEKTRQGEPLTPTAGQIPGDEVYCTTAQRFKEDLTTPPVVQLLTSTLHAHERAGVQMRLSKVSTVAMTVSLAGRTVWTNRATVEGPKPRLLWATPAKPGTYDVTLRATDLAGNEEVATGTIVLQKAVMGHGRGRKPARAASVRLSRPARRLPAL